MRLDRPVTRPRSNGVIGTPIQGHPDLSLAWIESNVPYTALPMAKFVEGMRKAGLE